jgi:stage II sporulation protein D (peptidoglycan lytic transglycosylase)
VTIRATLLALALTAATASASAAPATIRVALVEGARSVELRGTDIVVTEAGCAFCPLRSWRSDVVRASIGGVAVEIDGRRAVAFALSSDRPIRLNGRDYAGRLGLIRNGDGLLAVVNEVPLEDYLVGVLRAESSERWPLEALRAQAIVSRTYAAYHRMLNADKPYHIVASTAHQQFVGVVATTSPIWIAVQETRGQVLRWEGELFPAFYHTNSGGYTEDPRTVFAARNMPGLRPVVCPMAAGSPHYQWSLDVRLVDLGDTLRRNGIDVGAIRGVEVSERTASLRATTVTVRGTARTQRLRGNDFRRMVGYDTLKSTLFAVAVDGELARFSGRGYGHGVGLCQWGAKGMAEQGSTARDILAFYYPGARLGLLDPR